jgi:hypothetical protein
MRYFMDLPVYTTDVSYPLTILLIGSVISIFLLAVPFWFKGCGVRIGCATGKQNQTGTGYSDYQFTKDPDRDAKRIQEIIDRHIQTATQLTNKYLEDQTNEQVYAQQCCTQYEERMEKVKV